MLSEELWREWNLAQRRCLGLLARKNFPEALMEVEPFIGDGCPPELRSEAFAFRGFAKEKMGEIYSAKEDFLEAYKFSFQATYQRYAIELTLGRLSLRTEDVEGAKYWYLNAVRTAIEDPSTSGASAVESFLGIKEASSWNPAEKEACERAIRQAWNLFSLPGAPDFNDLKDALQILAKASTSRLPASRDDPRPPTNHS